MFEAE
jgi:hypothetical protein